MLLILLVRKIPGAIFIGMFATAVIGMLLGVVEIPTQIFAPIPSLKPTFGALFEALPTIFTKDMIVVIFSFLFSPYQMQRGLTPPASYLLFNFT